MRRKQSKRGCWHTLRKAVWFHHFRHARTAPCHYCRASVRYDDATVEHLMPVLLGGTDDMSNLRIACERCNRERNLLLLAEADVPSWEWQWARAT